jgi:hypothetical protein
MEGAMKIISLGHGLITVVDDEDYEIYAKHTWHAQCLDGKQYGNYYAVRAIRENGKHVSIFLHREIAQTPEDLVVDHISGNTLDNRKQNLRNCTKIENSRNSKPRRNNMSSKYKGVSRFKGTNSFRAYIVINRKQKHLGMFTDEDQAAMAYNNAATQYFGEFARLNKIA